jgi:hypothetical protein
LGDKTALKILNLGQIISDQTFFRLVGVCSRGPQPAGEAARWLKRYLWPISFTSNPIASFHGSDLDRSKRPNVTVSQPGIT